MRQFLLLKASNFQLTAHCVLSPGVSGVVLNMQTPGVVESAGRVTLNESIIHDLCKKCAVAQEDKAFARLLSVIQCGDLLFRTLLEGHTRGVWFK